MPFLFFSRTSKKTCFYSVFLVTFLLVGLYLLTGSGSRKKDTQDFTVTVALDSEPKSLDPRHSTDANSMRVVDLIFQSLIRLNQKNQLAPSAAEKWLCQLKKCTFYINKNIHFSNGRGLKASDIVFSFQEFQSPKSPFFSAFQVIQSLNVKETTSHFILTLLLKKPSPKFLSVDLPVLKLLPEQETRAAPRHFYKNPIGSGAFVLESQKPGSLVLKASPFHHPLKTRVVFKIIRDDLTRYQKTLKGKIDIAQSVLPFGKIKNFSDKDFQIFKNLSSSVTYILINFKDPCLRLKPFRKILLESVDPVALIRHKLKGFAVPARGLLNPHHAFFNPRLPVLPHRLKEAQKQFQKLSPKCQAHPLVLNTGGSFTSLSYGRVLSQHMRNSGLKVKLKSFEWGTFYEDLNKGRFQLALLKWVGVLDPDIYRLAFHSHEHPPKGRNRGFYSHAPLDRLLQKAQSLLSTKKRKKIYHQIQSMVYEDIAFIPLWHEEQVAVVKNNIKNYQLSPRGDFWFLHHIRREGP